MATIANQIQRIAQSTKTLRDKGIALGLKFPGGNYWDNTSKQYQAYQASALSATDQIDKIAQAYATINPHLNEDFRVPINVRTDGKTTVVETTKLPDGFYSNTTVTPYVLVQEEQDIIINVENVADRQLTEQTATIFPSAGFNYIGQFGYTIVSGAISETNVGYGNDFVKAKVSTSGWLDADTVHTIEVQESTLQSKVGTDGAVTNLGTSSEIVPNVVDDTVITIGQGIYGSNRTITVKSLKSQTSGDNLATSADILEGKVAYVNGLSVTGSMPDHGGDTVEALGFNNVGGLLHVTPALGYYTENSSIKTTIPYKTIADRVFNTTAVTVDGTDTLTESIYYETIPAGYYANAIIRKIEAQQAVIQKDIVYGEKGKAVVTVAGNGGWISGTIEIPIDAGPARFELQESDLNTNEITLLPARDKDGTINSYLTQVTVDNSIIFELLSEI